MSKGENRNKPCFCGSGKKYKHCCLDKRKTRKICITLDMGKPVTANAVRLSSDGKIGLLNNGVSLVPQNASIETGYQRRKGLKVLNKLKLTNEQLLTDPNLALTRYNFVLALDTNTKSLNNGLLSVACIVLCKFAPKVGYILAQYAPVHCLEFRNIQGKPENIAWKRTVEMVMANPSYDKSKNMGIVIDSDLSNIPDYNARRKPIVDDFYLPVNVELLYASADAGREYLPNKLISLCDKEAKELINYIQANPEDTSNLMTVNNLPYTHFRMWNT